MTLFNGVAILVGLVLFLGPLMRVLLSSKLHTPLQRAGWGLLVFFVPLVGFLIFLFAVVYPRAAHLPKLT